MSAWRDEVQTLALISTLLLAADASQQDGDPAFSTNSKGYREAYEQGVEEAERELKDGRATLYVFGLRMGDEDLDRKTGLPYKTIAGCAIDSHVLGLAAGHDERINAHINTHGLPPNSFKKYEGDLFDLLGFFDRESKAHQPARLTVGDAILKSPDGRYSIRAVEKPFTKDNGSRGTMLYLAITGDDGAERSLPVFWHESVTELLWGPRGSRFAVVRCKTAAKPDDYFSCFYLAVDLERGKSLREIGLKNDGFRLRPPRAAQSSGIRRLGSPIRERRPPG
jgi:hypothetical protein